MPGFEPPATSARPNFSKMQRLLVARDPRAGVAHRDPHAAVRRDGRDPHLAAVRRVLDRVLDQVAEHLPQPLAVAADRRQRAANRRDDRHVLLRERRRLDGLADDSAEIDVLEAVAERPRLDPRGVEDVADERREPRRLVADQREERLALLGGQHPPAVLQRPRRADHRRHRAAQLVRDERDEVGAERREAARAPRRVRRSAS